MASDDAGSGRATSTSSPFGLLLPPEHGGARFLPLVIGLIVIACTVVIAERQYASERRALEKATAGALREISGTIEVRMQSQLAALTRLRERWVKGSGLGEDQFMRHAGALVRDFEHIRTIEWADRDYVIRWMATTPGVESIVGQSVARTPEERALCDAARKVTGASISSPHELMTGGVGFAVSYALHVDGEFDGFLLGIYEGGVVIESMLAHVATQFDVAVAGTMGPLWARPGIEGDPRYARSADVAVENQTWTITVAPGPELVSTYLTPLPVLILAGGVLFGVLFASALRGAWMGRLRNRRLREANSRLAGEVTRRTAAEEAEKAARDELVSVANSLPAYLWSAIAQPDGSMRMRYQSRFIETISGRPSATYWKRSDWISHVHPEDRERVVGTFNALLSGELDEDSNEYRFLRADGDVRYIRQRMKATDTPEGRRLDGIALDFTDLRRAEEERAQLEARMQETQRLESLGGLAGGIAHDFNNLLVAMLGHATLAREELTPDHPAQPSLSSIERAARRAADLCRQMLAYAGMGSVAEERIDLREVVEELRDLLRASIPRTITLETEQDHEPAGVEVDPSQLRQVVLNLITNASEAIGAGPGCIDMSVRQSEIDEAELAGFLLGETLEPGRYVVLRVRDDGCGMDEGAQRRIFEPFYTTKFQGRGLGLAAVLGIVRRCRGALRIESAPGQGTTMTVLLRPVALPVDVALPEAPSLAAQVDGGHVLLVEDDEAAREFAATVLERAGLRVSQAADGVEGLEFFEKHRHEVQCVVLDLTMPRMDGVEAGRRMRALDAEVTLILSSGYPEQDAMKRFGALGITSFLQKPYEPHRLVDAVRDAMRSRAGGAESGAEQDRARSEVADA